MKEYIDVTMNERHELLSNSDPEDEDVEVYEDRSPGIRDTLLIEATEPEPLVSLLYLLSLTCGVGG